MIRKLVRSMALVIALCLSIGPAPARAAPDATASVVRQLRDQGYRDIDIDRTFLGRDVVTARGQTHDREIVIDPRSGVMLRDLVRQHRHAGSTDLPVIGGTDNRGSGRAGRDSDDDDDDDDDTDDDDGDDDNSGSGSGSSGSGGGNSGSGSDDSGSDDSGSDDGGSDDGGSGNSGSGGGNSGSGSDNSGSGSDGGGRDGDD